MERNEVGPMNQYIQRNETYLWAAEHSSAASMATYAPQCC